MRWISSALLVLVASCGPDDEAARKELGELERSLDALAAAPVEDWPGRLDEIRRLPISASPVREVRTKCTAAYEAYTTAAAHLREARDRVARVERETQRLTEGDGGGDVPALGQLHRQAIEATDDVGSSLDRAQQLVDDCRALREQLRSSLGG